MAEPSITVQGNCSCCLPSCVLCGVSCGAGYIGGPLAALLEVVGDCPEIVILNSAGELVEVTPAEAEAFCPNTIPAFLSCTGETVNCPERAWGLPPPPPFPYPPGYVPPLSWTAIGPPPANCTYVMPSQIGASIGCKALNGIGPNGGGEGRSWCLNPPPLLMTSLFISVPGDPLLIVFELPIYRDVFTGIICGTCRFRVTVTDTNPP